MASGTITLKSKGRVSRYSLSDMGDIIQFIGRSITSKLAQPTKYTKLTKHILREGVKRNFARGRAGGWRPFKRSTYVIRAIKGFPFQQFPMLRRTGLMENGFTSMTYDILGKDKMIFTLINAAPYAAIQNDGGTTVADRIALQNVGAGKTRRGHLRILVEPDTKGPLRRKFKHYKNPKREEVTVRVPARPFAYMDELTIKQLQEEFFKEIISLVVHDA